MINQVINKLLTNAKFKFYKYTALPVCLYVLVCADICPKTCAQPVGITYSTPRLYSQANILKKDKHYLYDIKESKN